MRNKRIQEVGRELEGNQKKNKSERERKGVRLLYTSIGVSSLIKNFNVFILQFQSPDKLKKIIMKWPNKKPQLFCSGVAFFPEYANAIMSFEAHVHQ